MVDSSTHISMLSYKGALVYYYCQIIMTNSEKGHFHFIMLEYCEKNPCLCDISFDYVITPHAIAYQVMFLNNCLSYDKLSVLLLNHRCFFCCRILYTMECILVHFCCLGNTNCWLYILQKVSTHGI